MTFTVTPSSSQTSQTVTATSHSNVYTVSAFDLETLANLFDAARTQVRDSGAALSAATIAVNGPAKTVTVTWTTVP